MLRTLVYISLIFLVSCSSSKTAQIKYQDFFDFTQITTYSLYKRDHVFNEWQSISDVLRNDIELAIENTLDSTGFKYTNVEHADVILTYYLADQNPRSLKAYNNGVNYCSYCLISADSGVRSDRLNIQSGHIIIDAIDSRSKRSVWRASAPLKIKEKDNSQVAQAKIHQVVAQMLSTLGHSKTAHLKS